MEFCCKYLLIQLKTLSYHISRVYDCHTKTFCILHKHHVMIMVSIIKGADLRTLQNISTYKEIDCGYVLQIAGHISLL